MTLSKTQAIVGLTVLLAGILVRGTFWVAAANEDHKTIKSVSQAVVYLTETQRQEEREQQIREELLAELCQRGDLDPTVCPPLVLRTPYVGEHE